MNNKLQELTDKIYLEGVEKGKNEAKEITYAHRSCAGSRSLRLRPHGVQER